MASASDPDRPDPIRLGQFLKATGLAESGGEAHEFVREGWVSVDGEVETRRGRRLHHGQRVTLRRPGAPEVTAVVETG